MGQRYPSTKQIAGSSKSFAHVAQEEEFGRRHAIRMRSDLSLANIDFAVWQELAKVIVSPTDTETEL